MAAHGEVKHDYHLVNPSPWPFLTSLSMFIMAIGAVIYMRGLAMPAEGADTASQLINALFVEGDIIIMAVGFVATAACAFGWWADVVRESSAGHHTPVVDLHLRYGMILFIASEVMFFVAWFWMFFEFSIFFEHRASWYVPTWDAETAAKFGQWPPPNVETFDPWHLPLVNTLILLLSGTTVTWAHHALQEGNRNAAKVGLALTIVLGALFTCVQIYEYSVAGFAFGNQGSVQTANIYGSAFFMATGFHGAHVVIGTIFLTVCFLRLMAGHFTPKKHFGFEAAAWYWHFVDVVWLFLFVFVYVAPRLVLE
jgi:cytochrome c oxidase subunit III